MSDALVELPMPSLGADMESGKLVRWLRAPGDSVERGEPIAEVETDKGIIVIEVFTTGVLERLVVEPGSEVAVGTVLAFVRASGAGDVAPPLATPTAPVVPEAPRETARAPASAPAASPPPPPPPSAVAGPTEPPLAQGAFRRASGLARGMARAANVALESVAGSGPAGAIVAADVRRAMERSAASAEPASSAEARPGPARETASASMRRVIAAAMARSKREIPHFYVGQSVDMGAALEWLRSENERLPPASRYSPAVLFVWAVARALRKVPELNARWQGDAAPPLDAIHVGCAVSLRGGGLVAPAIHDADRKPLPALMAAFRDLVDRAKKGGLRASEMGDATITVTSLGDRGVDWLLPIIFWPQVAIVGVGKITDKPCAYDGAVVVRPTVELTLAADHRVLDGHRAAAFLSSVGELLRDPSRALRPPTEHT